MPNYRIRSDWRLKVLVFSIWVALVALYFLWETAHYRGLVALLGEWQFTNFGRYLPTFTYALVVFVLTVPGMLLFRRPRRSRSGEETARVIYSGTVFTRALAGVAGGLAIAAVVALLAMATLPSSQGPVQRVAVQPNNAAVAREGATELRGVVDYERTAAFDADLLASRYSRRFAPVLAPNQTATTLQYFVELPPVDGPYDARMATLTGVMRQGGLPGELIRLYRYAGYEIDRPYFVLFINPDTMRRPYLVAALQLAIGAILAAVLALLQRRRVQRLQHRLDTQNG